MNRAENVDIFEANAQLYQRLLQELLQIEKERADQ